MDVLSICECFIYDGIGASGAGLSRFGNASRNIGVVFQRLGTVPVIVIFVGRLSRFIIVYYLVLFDIPREEICYRVWVCLLNDLFFFLYIFELVLIR